MKPLRKKELTRLLNHIADGYAGDYASVAHDLYRAIYFLHFLEEDQIPRNEVQNISFALHQLGECFHWAHGDRIRYLHQSHRETLIEIAKILKS